ncbi:hypothetical protein NIES2098_15300 [Calothrix sp. NIES-2098]|nr:hypothetical protein NIES2098_15300 [Calothrix sp. NIES-2098]
MMAYMKWFLHQFFNMEFFINCVLIISLGLTVATVARYQSLQEQRYPSGYSDSSGVR